MPPLRLYLDAASLKSLERHVYLSCRLQSCLHTLLPISIDQIFDLSCKLQSCLHAAPLKSLTDLFTIRRLSDNNLRNHLSQLWPRRSYLGCHFISLRLQMPTVAIQISTSLPALLPCGFTQNGHPGHRGHRHCPSPKISSLCVASTKTASRYLSHLSTFLWGITHFEPYVTTLFPHFSQRVLGVLSGLVQAQRHCGSFHSVYYTRWDYRCGSNHYQPLYLTVMTTLSPKLS